MSTFDIVGDTHQRVQILTHGLQDYLAEFDRVFLASLGSPIQQCYMPVISAALEPVQRTHQAGRVRDDARPLLGRRNPLIVF